MRDGSGSRFVGDGAAVTDEQEARQNNRGKEQDTFVLGPGGKASGESGEREESRRTLSRKGIVIEAIVVKAEKGDGCEEEEREWDICVLPGSECDEGGRGQQRCGAQHGGQTAAQNGKR